MSFCFTFVCIFYDLCKASASLLLYAVLYQQMVLLQCFCHALTQLCVYLYQILLVLILIYALNERNMLWFDNILFWPISIVLVISVFQCLQFLLFCLLMMISGSKTKDFLTLLSEGTVSECQAELFSLLHHSLELHNLSTVQLLLNHYWLYFVILLYANWHASSNTSTSRKWSILGFQNFLPSQLPISLQNPSFGFACGN